MKHALKMHVPGLGPDRSNYNQSRLWSRLHTTLAQITQITPKVNLHRNWMYYIENFFTVQDFWATCSCPEIFHCIEHTSTFRISEQLALALKTGFALKIFTVLKHFYHSGFLSNLHLPWKTECALKIFIVLKHFYHSGFLSNLRLPWNFSLYWTYFYIQDFWANCACLEIFQARGAATPRLVRPCWQVGMRGFPAWVSGGFFQWGGISGFFSGGEQKHFVRGGTTW